MRLRITTPLEAIVDDEGVKALTAEDASGGFGVLPGHADFLTSLSISVVSWQGVDARRRYCAVRGGVFSVTAGREIAVATRDAIAGDDLATLDQTVLGRFRTDLESERTEHVESTRLQLNAIRQMVGRIRADGRRGRGLFT